MILFVYRISELLFKARRIIWVLAVCAILGSGWTGISQTIRPLEGPEILEELRTFNVMGTLLFVAAHPDDENTQLITYSSKGRRYRTAYLSLTRGDGGQNVIGSEFNESLGLIRTQELLAARRLDGGRQFFTRAIDFGYSKSSDETLLIWDRKQVLGDVVRVIRRFRPDVIVTRYSPQPGGTHGHHTASAILALEAFQLAGDPDAYPEQLDTLEPWKPVRVLQNARGRASSDGVIQIPADGQDPVTGADFSDIAGRSRAMHKSQGFDNFGGRFGRGGARNETFTHLAGDPASEDIFDGIDTGWTRVSGGEQVAHLTDAAIESFDPVNPEKSVRALLEIRRLIDALSGDPLVQEKIKDLNRIIQNCLGLTFETRIASRELVPGERFRLVHTATIQSDSVPVQWVRIRYPVPAMSGLDVSVELEPYNAVSRRASHLLPDDMPLSQPYWLSLPHEHGIYQTGNPEMIGLAENSPDIPVIWEFKVDGQTILIPDEPVGPSSELTSRNPLKVIPPVWLEWSSNTQLFAPGTTHRVEVIAEASRPDTAGVVRIEVPEGWSVKPAVREFRFGASGDSDRFAFDVTAPDVAARSVVKATAEVNGRSYSNGRIDIRYDHIPPQLLQPAAEMEAVSLHMDKLGERVGYVPGAGDSIAQNLAEMGYAVTNIEASEISPEKLAGLDSIVVGIRAFETQDVLKSRIPVLFEYAESGGTVIMQYNRENGLDSAPLPLGISRNRITDEKALVTFLAPDHPVLNTPNRITAEDFEGWVQERSIYVPNEWDDAYVPIVAANDPGEGPISGQLLVAKHGKGYFVYTSFVFFRQLPAGVPGAWRLFANLVSLGKE